MRMVLAFAAGVAFGCALSCARRRHEAGHGPERRRTGAEWGPETPPHVTPEGGPGMTDAPHRSPLSPHPQPIQPG